MKWKPWDGEREVSKEERYSKVLDLIFSGTPYNSLKGWTNREIMDAWEELE